MNGFFDEGRMIKAILKILGVILLILVIAGFLVVSLETFTRAKEESVPWDWKNNK